MKTFLLSFALLVASAATMKSYSQVGGCIGGPNNCAIAITNVVVKIVSAGANPSNPAQTLVTFDVGFDISYNGGNTTFFVNAYLSQDYPNPLVFDCTKNGNPSAPTATQLGTTSTAVGKSFLDFEIPNPARGAVGVVVPLTFASTYQYDGTVALTYPGMPVINNAALTATKTFLSGTTDRMEIKNATVILNQPFGSNITVKTDVWAINGNAKCFVAGITQSYNNPVIAGFLNCDRPAQKVSYSITTPDATPSTLTYKVWLDKNDNGIVDGTDAVIIGPIVLANFSSSNGVTTGGPVTYPGSNTADVANHQLIIDATTDQIGNTIRVVIPRAQGCIGLPVAFKSFEATRSRGNVVVTFETATEINNSGFAVERNVNGTWQQVAFIPSQAAGGNSDRVLAYSYTDPNDTRGISLYRIRQVDLDAKSKYSDTRSVRGDGQIGKTIVFPNPSADGKITVVFEDVNVKRDLSVTDMSGRTVQTVKGVSNNNVQISNLAPGVYSLRIVVPSTGDMSIEKIVISNRH
jgi:hypothetical protein